MALVNQPAILPGFFAAEGDKNLIPANNDGLSGLASIAKGFPPITQLPLAQGGLPPQRQDFNGIFNLFSQFLLFMQNGGVFGYNNTLDYQPPAMIWDNNNLWKCKKVNGPNTPNGVQPTSNAEYWELVSSPISVTEDGGIVTITQGDGAGTSFAAAINLLQRKKTYSVGDISYSANLPSWAYLECTTAGTTGDTEPSSLNLAQLNQTITDGGVTWTVRGQSVAQKLTTNDVGTANKPIYLKDGVPTAFSENVGTDATPLYLLNGVLTACSSSLGAANNGGIVAALLEQNGYVKFANGLIIQWGITPYTTKNPTAVFPISFTSNAYTCVSQMESSSSTSNNWGFPKYNTLTNKSVTFILNANSDERVFWIAIGK